MINLLSNSVWSEADILAHGRAKIASVVGEARQNELRTIMLGHIAQMRVASPDELAEIALVQQVTEQQVINNEQMRADNALLASVLAYEAQLARLELPEVTEPATVIVDDVEVPNPAIEQDAAERADATIKIANASVQVAALYALRHPAPEPVEEVAMP